jgi:hypothetical protein
LAIFRCVLQCFTKKITMFGQPFQKTLVTLNIFYPKTIFDTQKSKMLRILVGTVFWGLNYLSDTCGGHKNSCGLMEKINPRHSKLLKRIHVSIKVFSWPAEPVGTVVKTRGSPSKERCAICKSQVLLSRSYVVNFMIF